MLAAIAECVVTSALPEPGSDFYCYRLTVPWALLSFKCAPLQSSLPHLVCVIATGGALQASLAPWVPCCSSGFLGCSFPQHFCVASVNSWDLAMSSLLSCVLSSYLLLICLQFYLHCCPEYQLCPMSRCRSRCCLLPDGWSSAQSLSYSGFTLSYFYCWERWSIPASSCLWLLTACLPAYPGVLIFLLIGLLLSWCLVPGRVAVRAQHFQADISSCLCSFCSWLFTVIPAFHLFCRYPGEEVLCSASHGTESFEFCCSALQPTVWENVPCVSWSHFLLECPPHSLLFRKRSNNLIWPCSSCL